MWSERNRGSRGALVLAVVAGVLVVSGLARAGPPSGKPKYAPSYLKWCTSWTAQYVDGAIGEDVFASPDVQAIPAKHAWAEVHLPATGHTVWSGKLDANGCTPAFSVGDNTTYRLTQGTYVYQPGRAIFAEFEGADWGPYFVSVDTFFTTGTWPPGYGYVHESQPMLHTPATNLAAIAGEIIDHYEDDALQVPYGTLTMFRTDEEGCTVNGILYTAGYMGPTNEHPDEAICILNDTVNGGEDYTSWKFIVAHEFGHRQAQATGGPLTGYYVANEYEGLQEPLCICEHVVTHSPLHCLQSREYIGSAEKEGWAYFYAAALFNNRDDGDCQMAYPKEVLMYRGEFPVLMTRYPPVPISCDHSLRWMDTYCDPGEMNRGIEWDWLTFFWSLWTQGGDDRYDISEMTHVWSQTDDSEIENCPGTWGGYYYSVCDVGETWDDLRQTVESLYGHDDSHFENFRQFGEESGVDHYSQ